jgi:YihY family inner membrane protein
MSIIDRTKRRVDVLQERNGWVARAVAVAKKFSDDEAGQLAAVVAFYGFLSLFPLLLVFVTLSSWLLTDRPDLQDELLDSALAQFPLIGDQLRDNVGQIEGSGLAFVVGVLVALWGGLGVVQAMQAAMNRAWDVPPAARPNFVTTRLRSIAMLAVLGVGVIASTVLNSVAGGLDGLGALGRVALLAASIVVSIGLFLVAFRLLPACSLRWRDVAPGAVLAAIAWVGLQTFGVALLSNRLRDASALYGMFGVVIGLLGWMYIQAQLTMVATELNVVLRERLWPRRLFDEDAVPTPRASAA